MYVIIVYDVDVNRNRPVLTYLRTHLNWIQNSVFEGEVTEGELREIKTRLDNIIEEDEDSVVIYALSTDRYMDRTVIGEEPGTTDRLL